MGGWGGGRGGVRNQEVSLTRERENAKGRIGNIIGKMAGHLASGPCLGVNFFWGENKGENVLDPKGRGG